MFFCSCSFLLLSFWDEVLWSFYKIVFESYSITNRVCVWTLQKQKTSLPRKRPCLIWLEVWKVTAIASEHVTLSPPFRMVASFAKRETRPPLVSATHLTCARSAMRCCFSAGRIIEWYCSILPPPLPFLASNALCSCCCWSCCLTNSKNLCTNLHWHVQGLPIVIESNEV